MTIVVSMHIFNAGPHSSIFEFTSSFEDVSIELVRRRALNLPADAITIDGGP